MESISVAKSKKSNDKLNYISSFLNKLQYLIASIVKAHQDSQINHPYIRQESEIKKIAVLVITADRGLCGGYNSNVIKTAKNYLSDLRSKYIPYDLFVIGKKGISSFNFLKESINTSFTSIDEKISYKEIENIISKIIVLFENKQVERIEIISSVYISSSSQIPKITSLLPISFDEPLKLDSDSNYLFEPNIEEICYRLLPFYIKTKFFNLILSAICSEHIARKIAMKSATDASTDIIKNLTRTYNRIRQAKITQEISEIVAGADSIS